MTYYNKFGRLCEGKKPLSDDWRHVIITDIKESGGNSETAAVPYGIYTKLSKKHRVSPQTVQNVWKRYCETSSVASLKGGNISGKLKKLTAEDEQYIEQLLTEDPTMHQNEIITKLLQYSNTPNLTKISQTTISVTIRKRLSGGEWTRKKVKSSNANRYSAENMDLTTEYFNLISQHDKYTIKFMDEAGVNTAMGRRKYGYAPKGQVAVDITKHAQSPNYTVNLLVGLDGTKFCTVLDGPSNTYEYVHFFHQAMNAYNDQGRPVLQAGDIIVVDNCSFHHSDSERMLRNYFVDYGIEYVFLPKYSPDLNPVESCFMKMKTLFKQKYYQELLANNFVKPAVMDAIYEISASDLHGFYRGTTDNYMNV